MKKIRSGGPAASIDLNVNDELIALNGFRLTPENFKNLFELQTIGTAAELTTARNGIMRAVSITPNMPPPNEYKIVKTEHPTTIQKYLYKSWLGAEWD